MTVSWASKKDKERYGIVICNFYQEGVNRLRLTVGESVHILQENGDWYFGFSVKKRSLRGIFPKSYVQIMDSIADKSGPTEVMILKQPYIVQEITSVLREWGNLWKHLYITHSEHFKTIEIKMYELMKLRSLIKSGTLPVDELKQIKRQVTSKIDVGNKLLGLDMVVRDDTGNVLNPDVTSTIELCSQHHLATDRINKATSDLTEVESKLSPSSQVPTLTKVGQYSHILIVGVHNFICKLTEDVELLMSLYDAKENKSFTENFVVRWPKQALEPDKMFNHRALFSDLGTKDCAREKVYLVCYVVRLGGMEKPSDKPVKNHSTDLIRRPFGVAAMDVSLILNRKIEPDEDKHHFVPFLQCEKESNLDATLKKILSLKELTQKEHKSQGLFVSYKMLQGDLKQAREENPHLVLGQVSVARKMGFPEVILPGDVRNDLYLTLVSGEFSKGTKSTDKNVQVSVTVWNEAGEVLQGVMQGCGEDESEYRSVVYYHEDKPRWLETCKVAVPIEDFKNSHLRFTFKHRSSNETKDKSEKPFAMSFVKLMQENGTTLPDTVHELLVYKVDHKKFDPLDMSYLSLPSKRHELEDGDKPSITGLSLTNKDSFIITTNICSTKLTHNVDLLGLLNWTSQPENKLSESLLALMKVSGEEIVKFLQDVLDALFNILVTNSESDKYDTEVFNCLLYIIGLVSDRKYQHFQPVLDLYIKESFCATLAYSKLIVVLRNYIDKASYGTAADKEVLLKTMKSLQYCIRFIVRSRQLYSELNEGKDHQGFVLALREMLKSIAVLMCNATDSTLLVQAACLKYLPSTIPDILTVFSGPQLGELLAEMINNVPPHRLCKQKMMTINEIIKSPLFLLPDSRRILLPVILTHTKDLLEARDEEFRNKTKSVAKVAKVLGESEAKLSEEASDKQEVFEKVDLCVQILSDIMDLLFKDASNPSLLDVSEIMLTVLRTVIQSTIAMDRDSPFIGRLVAVMLSILRQMTAHHFESYINHFPTRTDLLDFLMEILLVFKDLVSRPVYPNDWSEMILLQNSIILKSLRFFSHTIRDCFFQRFEHQAWNNFFHCAIAFLTQPALQLEKFSTSKRWRIISRYKDMRREMGFEIRSMWFNLGQHKIQLVPGLVGPFLEMTLIPEIELRRAIIPIFFDMMQCEFYSSREGSSLFETKRDSSHIKASFSEFENEMIAKLDNLVESGKGDEEYKELFREIMTSLCENHSTLNDTGLKFVKTVTRLMERLLEYRAVITDENKENRMSCTVNLLDFYSEINRKEMYIRYVNKLCDLHLECDNFTEAAYTLKLHSKLLNWSDTPLSTMLKSPKYPGCTTHRQLKEALYHDMLKYFDLGKMWECAVEICKELAKLYEESDYTQLSALLRRMAQFYDNIMLKLRPEPEYFRVAYYGRGFPGFLQNKVFIYRGKEYERLSDFCTRTLNQLPHAELMNTLTPPGEDITESPLQYVQINKVEPIMDEKKQRHFGKPVSESILKYYRVNNVQKFRFSRPYHRREDCNEDDNEFASLWLERNVLVTSYPLPGILRWFPVTSTHTYQLSPLSNAIETMQSANKSLRDLITQLNSDPSLPLNPLSMKLNGILDAAVNGGITNYEKAFFTSGYLDRHPEDTSQIALLKELIACQIPLLEVGLKVHGELAPPSLGPFHQRLLHCFATTSNHVVTHYGAKTCDIKYEPLTSLRRQTLSTPHSNGDLVNRLSSSSFGSIEGARIRSSPSRSQVSTLKTFVNFASLSPNTTLTRASSIHTRTPSRSSSVLGVVVGGSNTTGRNKEKKKKRRSGSKGEIMCEEPTTRSQWYTIPSTITPVLGEDVSSSPIMYELNQQLTPSRPLRRLSRPLSSGSTGSGGSSSAMHTPPPLPQSLVACLTSSQSLPNGNRDSLATTDSTASEEDGVPPPLPVKQRAEVDYCNLPDITSNYQVLIPVASSPKVRNKPVPPEPVDASDGPPTPPPKRPLPVPPS